MTKISNLYTLTNYISANSSGNVVIAAPASGYALDVTGTGRFTGALTGTSATFSSSVGTAALNMNNMSALGSISGGAIFLPYTAPIAFRSADGSIGYGNIKANNSGAILLNSGAEGSVGIATSSPGAPLEVRGGAGANLRVRANGTNVLLLQNYNDTDAYHQMQFAASDLIFSTGTETGTSASERVRVTNDGVIQFSTIAIVPTYNNSIYSYSTNGYMYIQGGSTGLALAGSGNRNNAIYVNSTNNEQYFHTNGGEKMRITSGGQVLIGQTTASGSVNGIYFRPGIESGFIVTSDVALQLSRLGTTGDIQTFYSGTTRVGKIAVGSSTVTFESASSGGLSVASSGNVLIGVSTDGGFPLLVGKQRDGGWQGGFVNSATGGTAQVFLSHGEGYGAYVDSGTLGASSARYIFKCVSGGSERFVVNGTGKTQINASASDYTLTMYNSASSAYGMYLSYSGYSPNSTNFEFIYCIDSTNSKFIVWSNGSVVNRTGSYGTISDIKYKENIVDATPKLDDLMNLKVRNFNLIGESTKQIGFIAQEFEEVFPNMVDVSTERGMDGETYKSIKTSVLVPMLVKAIQELSAKVTALENK